MKQWGAKLTVEQLMQGSEEALNKFKMVFECERLRSEHNGLVSYALTHRARQIARVALAGISMAVIVFISWCVVK
jgi:hypothetical protein